MQNGVIFYEGSPLNLKTTPQNYGFLKRITSADDVFLDALKFQLGILSNGCDICFNGL